MYEYREKNAAASYIAYTWRIAIIHKHIIS